MYDLIIVGGGPAGIAAGIYASRKKIKTLLITESFGGQSIVAADIRNFIGFKSISGVDLSKAMEEHLRDQPEIEIQDGTLVSEIKKKNDGFAVKTNKEEKLEAKTVLLALGSRYRKLKVPGEKRFEGRGVFYCSTCDAPLMKNKKTAVIGGGNSGFEAIIDLMPYASEIRLLEYSDVLKADPVTQEKVKNSGKAEMITMAEVKEIFGNEFVTGLRYQDRKTGEIKELAIDGVFVAIGWQPNSEIAKDLVDLDEAGAVIIDPKTQKTSIEGVWAAGDVTDGLYHQNNIAMGDGVRAVLNIYDYLK